MDDTQDMFSLIDSIGQNADAVPPPSRKDELRIRLREARESYYQGQPKVADEVYDAWRDELAELDAHADEVVQIGAAPVSAWPKVAHSSPMGSLDKVNTLDELTVWLSGICGPPRMAVVLPDASSNMLPSAPPGPLGEPLLVTEKLDGISIHVRYEKGRFVQALTRGDGVIGEDITPNVARMQGVSARVKGLTASLRGEIVVLRSDFKHHFPNYANPRNAAAGISHRYDGKGCEHLTVMFYAVQDGVDFSTEREQFEFLAKCGLKTPNWFVSGVWPGIKTPHDLWVEYQQYRRDQLDYDIDGLVVRLDDLSKQISLGEKNGRPLGAVAFKFAPISRETAIRAIPAQVGGTGHITPVAEFDPVWLLGSKVSRASLYNYGYIRELGLDIGARVLVARAGDVIPRVVALVRGTGTVAAPPTTCPECGAAVAWEGEYLVCPNTAVCPAQTVGRLKRFVRGMDILEWGDTLIERLVELGAAKSVVDLYKLTAVDLCKVERMGEKSAATVLKTLREKNPVPLDILLGSLSIPGCAAATIRMVMDAGYDTFDKLREASQPELEAVVGLGPVKATALHTWLANHGSLVLDLFEVGLRVKEKILGSLTGKSFVFTGTMSKPRPTLKSLVEERGGVVKTSVSKGVTYLVMASLDSGSAKAKAAAKHGTTCISEADLLSMVGSDG